MAPKQPREKRALKVREENRLVTGRPGPVVLVVDDEQVAHALVRSALKSSGLQADVRSVYSGEEALEVLMPAMGGSARLPDAVVLDLNLPGMDGTDVLRVIRATPATATLPVFVHTGSEDPQVLGAAFRAGADAVICKTLPTADYFRCLSASIMKHFSAQDALVSYSYHGDVQALGA